MDASSSASGSLCSPHAESGRSESDLADREWLLLCFVSPLVAAGGIGEVLQLALVEDAWVVALCEPCLRPCRMVSSLEGATVSDDFVFLDSVVSDPLP